MFSVDPYVTDPSDAQTYNSYSYANNNPLKYNDKNGQWVHIVIGAVIGGTINVVSHWDKITKNGFDGWAFAEAFGVGAAAGAITAATGGAAVAELGALGVTSGVALGASAGLAGSATGSVVQGLGNSIFFKDKYTAKQFGNEVLLGTGLGAIGGGLNSLWNGKNVIPSQPVIEPLETTGTGFPTENSNGAIGLNDAKGIFEPYGNPELDEVVIKPEGVAPDCTYTNSAGKHLNESVLKGETRGELSRPYMRYPNLMSKTIMSAGEGVPDASYPGGMNWNVNGYFRGSDGIWELGIHPETNVIYHINFISH